VFFASFASFATSVEGSGGPLESLLATAVSLLAQGFQLHVLGLQLLPDDWQPVIPSDKAISNPN
jgi:hypothetical protein